MASTDDRIDPMASEDVSGVAEPDTAMDEETMLSETPAPVEAGESADKPTTTDEPATDDKQAKRRFSRGWIFVVALAIVLVAGGFGFYSLSNVLAHTSWEAHLSSGDAVATLTIPALGSHEIPVLEGTSLDTLREGAGWYEGTASPGELGNFVVAGHRLGWGEPFADIGQLRIGDFITITTDAAAYTYTVITPLTVVAGDDVTILNPVPGGPDLEPTRRLITLTTAASLLPSPERLVVVGELVGD